MRTLTLLSLRRAAEHHVERHPVTARRLEDVLRRKVRAHARKHETDIPAEAESWIATIVEALVRTRVVDDRRLAEARTRTLRERGKSTRAVRASLRAKGVPDAVIGEVTAAGEGDGAIPLPEIDTAAAWTLARRKKLGPFRSPEARAEHRQKDLAALARAGFSFSLARRVVDAAPDDAP